jgi:exosortase
MLRCLPDTAPSALLVAFAFLWYRLIDHLRVEWTVNEQYAFGWAVPFLCAYLVWVRWPAFRSQPSTVNLESSLFRFLTCSFVLLAFLYFPTRLVLEATPEWRVISWLLAIEIVGLSLITLRIAGGTACLRHMALPICFFLVAVPWLRPIESPLIQGFTRANAATTVELLSFLGIPAIQHGNVIEVGTGIVGIDEACSGIRSFQASLMLSLFFALFYRLSAKRSMVLCSAGFGLALAFNVVRTVLLTWVAAKYGVSSISKWHDPAGVTILLGCFTGIWGVAAFWARKPKTQTVPTESLEIPAPSKPKAEKEEIGSANTRGYFQVSKSHISAASVAFLSWVILSDLGTVGWYRAHERNRAPQASWSAQPPQNSTLRALEIPPETRESLRYNEGSKWAWAEADGTKWQMLFFTWAPGRTWVKQVTRHSPEGCLSASGWKLLADLGLRFASVADFALGFQAFVFDAGGQKVHVFYCLWEEGAPTQPTLSGRATQTDRLKSVLDGRRNPGMRVLEFAVWGIEDEDAALLALQRQVARVVRLQ